MSEQATAEATEAPAQETVLESGTTTEATPEATQESRPSIVNENGEFVEGWNQSFDDLKEYNFDKFKSVDALAKSYAHLERQKGGAYYPQEDWNDDKIASYREAAGVPETPDGYQIKPENLPEGITWDDEYAAKISELAHKHHIPARALHELVEADLAHKQNDLNNFSTFVETSRKEAEDALRGEWGRDYDKNVDSAKTAFVQLAKDTNLTEEEANDLSSKLGNEPSFLKILARVGSSIQEAAMHGTSRSQGASYQGDEERMQELIRSGKWGSDPAVDREIEELSKKIASRNKG